MIILSAKDIKKYYGIEPVLENVSFTVQESDKIGVIGVNGAGKSTLFKILMGTLEKDDGEIYLGKGLKLGYMAQDFNFSSDNTIWEELLSIFSHFTDMEQTMREMEQRISELGKAGNAEALEALVKSYSNLQEAYKNQNGFGYQSQIKGVLKGLGFSPADYEKKVYTLSGGQKTRIALGKVLLQEFDILLLDEPTNYLDIESVEWLEDFLKNTRSSLLIVSHDRYFLDTITNKTFEIENNTLTEYNGNYTRYVELKREKREQQMKDYQLQQKEIERQEAIIARFRQYNREKSIKQAESREKALERIEKLERPDALPKSARFTFEPRIKSGNDVLFVEDLSKSFDRLLFKNISMEIKRGERVALLGPNGIGKTTILKIITGALRPDTGDIRLGTNVHVGYYDQEQHSLNYDKLVIDEIWDEYPQLTQSELRGKLAAFLFQGEEVFKEISKLSGGERSRIALLKLMLSKSNFLLMDEPTNHLDILSKEVLEDALVGYTGTVLLISHDRYFLNKVATKIIELTPDSCIPYAGNYSYYQFKKSQLVQSAPEAAKQEEAQQPSALKNDWLKQKEERSRERRQQKRLETVEKEIEEHENRIREIAMLMEQPEIFSDHVKLQELHDEEERLKAELEALYEEWGELTS